MGMRPFVGAFLFIVVVVVHASADISTPGELLIASSDPDAFLKPLIFNPVGSNTARANPLSGLLARQSGCPTGYGECSNPAGRCCPLGGRCCSGSGCCNPGYWCYASGCCLNSEFGCEQRTCCPIGSNCCKGGGCCDASDYCAISASGQRGCCPIGTVCSGSSGQCTTPGYVRCSGENFCCPAGDICYRDSSNNPRCRDSSSNLPPPAHTTTRTTTSFAGATTFTSTSPVTTTVSIPAPSSTPGSQNAVISATDSRITYTGGGWLTSTSTCNSSAVSKKTTMPYQSFSFTFSGSAVYMSVASNNVWYSVTYGTQSINFGNSTSTVAPSNCSISWSMTGLVASKLQTVMVYVYGSASNAAISSPFSFELNHFIVTMPNNSTTPQPSAKATGGSANGSIPAYTPQLTLLSSISVMAMILAAHFGL